MYLPFITKKKLYRRKGGGGGRGGGGESGGGGSSSGGSSSGGSRGGSDGSGSSGSSSGSRAPVPIGSGAGTGGKTSATPYGGGGGKVATIPSGQVFAGRSQGGGTRNQVFGTSTYGSGYPGLASQRGVSGLNFPFFFWPVVWGSTLGGAAYLHDTEYGKPNNSSRPGGVLMTVPFSSASGNTTLHIVADNATTTSLLSSVVANCSSFLASNSTGSQAVIAFDSTNTSMPQPEQAVEYYRASSITLTLDGYNDTTALQQNASANTPQTPIPSWVNSTMLDCLNQTIGAAAPLISSGSPLMGQPMHGAGAVCLGWLAWHLFSSMLL